jgi:tetratricopeptide (TPR) repeat protein
MLTALLASSASQVAFSQAISRESVEPATLAEDWSKAAELLESVTDDPEKSPDPVLRLVKGHACLALNRNNESVCLFLSVTVPEDLDQCLVWAKKLCEDHRGRPIAHYFLGDVEARLGHFDRAVAAYTEAIDPQKSHPMLHNARGVALACSGQLRPARLDFEMATSQAAVPLADAHANLGAFRIHRKSGAEAAIQAFDKALAISPDFALALHGRGCVRLVMKQTEDAKADFNDAQEHAGCISGVLADDLLNTVTYLSGHPVRSLEQARAEIASGNLGTTFKWGLEDKIAQLDRGDMNPLERHMAVVDIWNDYNRLSEEHKPQAMNALVDATQKYPEFGNQFIGTTWHLHDKVNDPDTGWAPRAFDLISNLEIVNSQWNLELFQEITNKHFHNQDAFLDRVGFDGGGVFSSFKGAIFDDQRWPFTPLYGLVFQPSPAESLSGMVR